MERIEKQNGGKGEVDAVVIMKTIKYILLFLFVVFCFTDCKKYPEGPRISLCPLTWKISGSWEVESFLINGSDSISQLTCIIYGFYIGEDERYMYSSKNGINDGDWRFLNKRKEIYITVNINIGSKTPFPITDATKTYPVSHLKWEIQRFTRKQFWLKINYNGKEYYVKFKMIKKDYP